MEGSSLCVVSLYIYTYKIEYIRIVYIYIYVCVYTFFPATFPEGCTPQESKCGFTLTEPEACQYTSPKKNLFYVRASNYVI